MCDGAASLMSMFFDMTAAGRWTEERDSNFLDGGAHFYGVYECACGRFISIGSIEPQFYALLRQHAGLTDADFDAQMDRKAWPALKREADRGVQEQDPRRMVRHHGGHRHLLRADPDHDGSAASIRTWPRAKFSSNATASPSPRRRRAFPARPRRSGMPETADIGGADERVEGGAVNALAPSFRGDAQHRARNALDNDADA